MLRTEAERHPSAAFQPDHTCRERPAIFHGEGHANFRPRGQLSQIEIGPGHLHRRPLVFSHPCRALPRPRPVCAVLIFETI